MRRVVLFEKTKDYKQKVFVREITITNNESSALTDFQVPIEIGGDFLEKADPNNLIITENDSVLPYWVEQWKRPSGKALIWTKVDLVASESKSLKLFYGGIWDNPPNGGNVFQFFDDFEGSELGDSWTYNNNGTLTVENSFVKLETGTTSGTSCHFGRSCSESLPYIVEARKYANAWGSGDDRSATIYMEDSGSNNAINLTLFRTNDGDYRVANKVSGSWNAQQTLATGLKLDTVYKVKVTYDNSNVIVTLYNDNGAQIASHTFSSFSFTPALLRLQSYNNGSSTNCIGLFDWVFLRKYTSNEPSVTIGSEQVELRTW